MKNRNIKYQKGATFPYIVNNPIVEFPDEAEGLDMDKYLGFGNPIEGQVPLSTNTTSPGQAVAKNNFNPMDIALPGISLATGIMDLIQARKEKRKLNAQIKNFKGEFERSKEESRRNDFYYTPYSTNRYKKGGKYVNIPEYQAGGDIDDFLAYVQGQQKNNNTVLDILQNSYQEQNELQKQKYLQLKNSGIKNTITGAIDIAKAFIAPGVPLEEGGEIDMESLYSADFMPPHKEQEDEIMSQVSQDMEWEDSISQWLMETPVKGRESLSMEDLHSHSTSSKELPIYSVVSKLESDGFKPSSVNTGTHNTNSKHYHGKAVDLGLNTTFGGNKRKMQEFLTYYNTVLKPQFPNITLHDERERPANQKVWSGSHYHIEIN